MSKIGGGMQSVKQVESQGESGFTIPLRILVAQDSLKAWYEEADSAKEKEFIIQLARAELAGGIQDLESMLVDFDPKHSQKFHEGMSCPHCQTEIMVADVDLAQLGEKFDQESVEAIQKLRSVARRRKVWSFLLLIVLPIASSLILGTIFAKAYIYLVVSLGIIYIFFALMIWGIWISKINSDYEKLVEKLWQEYGLTHLLED